MLSKFCSIILLLLLSHRIHARTHPNNNEASIVPDKHNYTWHEFEKFQHVTKGTSLDGISKLKSYLSKFGYLDKDAKIETDTFDSSLELAIEKYQRRLNLPITRSLDSGTLAHIMTPRCGVRDDVDLSSNGWRAGKKYADFAGRPRWRRGGRPMVLTYAFSPENKAGSLGAEEVRAAFGRAFGRWAEVIPVRFAESGDYRAADVKIGFYGGDHGDGEPFDGALGVLAHAFSPESGRLHLDAAETWAADLAAERGRNAVDLESVATHEIGHVLGLAHSGEREAVMYPSLRPRQRKVGLTVDDVQGVQALYGSNPNFSLAGFSESELASSGGDWGVGEGGGFFFRVRYLGLILVLCLCM